MREPAPDTALRPVQSPGARIEQRDGRVVVCDADTKVMLALNESAAALWELCDGSTTIDEMVTAICEISSIPDDRVRDDVERTLAEFRRAGLLALDG